MKRLCTINARGGSKGIKNKNIRPLLGKPLIAYSLEQAKASGLFKCVAVSSDSAAILEVAKAYGADYVIQRPEELATDQAPKLPAIRHGALESEKLTKTTFDTFVDLDATSPLRSIEDIQGSVALLESQGASNILTGTPARRSPYFNLVEVAANGTVALAKKLEVPVFRRQDAPACYDLNASIYVWNRSGLLQETNLFLPGTRLFVMPEERSHDIDSELDFKIVELLMAEQLQSRKPI